jgi:putative PIN family toxin of toxin-antitoxin system
MKKIIIDTNWWISFILSKHSFGLPDFFLNESIDFYFSNELLQEIKTTLTYTKRKERINEINLEQFFSFIEEFAVVVDTTSVVTICRDKKDNFLLALAKDAGADYLVSNDGDLLTIKKFETTEIVTLPQFLEIVNQQLL